MDHVRPIEIVPEDRTDESGFDGTWATLVKRVQLGDTTAEDELYARFYAKARAYLYHQAAFQHFEDMLQESFLVVWRAILRGELREPERLWCFARTVLRRQVIAHTRRPQQSGCGLVSLESVPRLFDTSGSPEQIHLHWERLKLLTQAISRLCRRDREILIRFYLKEQPADTICAEMGLTGTQFRLFKWRAKASFAAMGKHKLRAGGSVAFAKGGVPHAQPDR